jgi:putative transposase
MSIAQFFVRGKHLLDGTVVRVWLDKKATSISLLVVLGVRSDSQKVLLSVRNVGGETSEAWRAVLDDLIKRGLRKPEHLIVDGGAGLESALAQLWTDVATQRCSVQIMPTPVWESASEQTLHVMEAA